MRINSWSQQNIHDAAADLSLQGPYNSQTSLLQRGRLDPKPQFFVSLGQFNAAIEAQDLAAITRRSLKDRMTDAQPFITFDDRIATATDFFAMFIGAQPFNQLYIAKQQCTDAEAREHNNVAREAFRQYAMSRMLPPAEAWERLAPLCDGMTPQQVAKFREVLSGWSDWTPEEIDAMHHPGSGYKAAIAISKLESED